MSSKLDTSLLTAEKIEEFRDEDNAKIFVQKHVSNLLSRYTPARLGMTQTTQYSRTPDPAKNIYEFFELVRQVIVQYEIQEGKPEQNRVIFTYEDPDIPLQTTTITCSIARRAPGSFSQGGPFEGTVKNRGPILREVTADPNNPGYRLLVFGYWYDNIITLTPWCRTNKEANDRSIWLEKLMFEMEWFFRSCGVAKVLYDGRDREVAKGQDKNKIYGRPLRYFVRTELISTMSEKTLTRIVVDVNRNYLV